MVEKGYNRRRRNEESDEERKNNINTGRKQETKKIGQTQLKPIN
jgi:hypothetical protein